MGKLIVKAIVLVAAINSAAGGRAGEPRPEIPADLVLQEFVVVKGRGDLLVPVRIGEMDHFFVIDTGASYTVLDTSLCGGDPERAKTVSGPGGGFDLNIYKPPAASVGKLPLGPIDFVFGHDLTRVRVPVLAFASLVVLWAVRSARARRLKPRLEEKWPYTAP